MTADREPAPPAPPAEQHMWAEPSPWRSRSGNFLNDHSHLLPAQVSRDPVQVQVVPEILHLQLHELAPLQQVAVETLTGVAEAWAELQLGGAPAAEVLLAVDTHMLIERRSEREGLT